MNKVLFILLACSPIKFLKYQLKNILHFNPNSIICLNLSPELIQYKNELNTSSQIIFKKDDDEVGVKTHTNGKGFIRAWMSCYSHCRNLEFSHVCFLSSNELFFKKGAESYIFKNGTVSYQHENLNVKNPEFYHEYYTNSIKNKLLEKLNFPFCTFGQWEGSFFERHIFETMYNMVFDDISLDYGQSCDEVLIPSLLMNILKREYLEKNTHITKVRYEVGTEAPIDYLALENIFSVKRVSYNMDTLIFKIINNISNES